MGAGGYKPVEGRLVSVQRPYLDKGKWRVRMLCSDGTRPLRTFPDEDQASACYDKESAKVAEDSLNAYSSITIRKFDDTTKWWVDLLAELSLATVQATDRDERKELRADIQAISRAAQSIKSLTDQTAIEREVTELKAAIQSIIQRRKHAPRSEEGAATVTLPS